MFVLFHYLFVLPSFADLPTKDDIAEQYQERQDDWQQRYVDNMRALYPLGQITPGYLDTFLYRSVRLSAADQMGGTPDGELLIFNNILDESYFPLHLEKDRYSLNIIEVIPAGKVRKAQKKPEWWFAKGRVRTQHLNTLVNELGPSGSPGILQPPVPPNIGNLFQFPQDSKSLSFSHSLIKSFSH